MHNPAAINGVKCDPKCLTKLSKVSWLCCYKRQSSVWPEMVSNNKMVKFLSSPKKPLSVYQDKEHCPPLPVLLADPCLVFLIEPCLSLGCHQVCHHALRHLNQQVQPSCVHNIQPLSLYCLSIAPNLHFFRAALLMQQPFQSSVY